MKEEVRKVKEELDTIKKSDISHMRTLDARGGHSLGVSKYPQG